jgi:hypothetical protein
MPMKEGIIELRQRGVTSPDPRITRGTGWHSRILPISAFMTPSDFRNLTEANRVIRVAIVCEPEASVLADSVGALLADSNEFTFSRFEYHAEHWLTRSRACFGNPDVIVASLGLLKQRRRTFVSHRSSALSHIAQCSSQVHIRTHSIFSGCSKWAPLIFCCLRCDNLNCYRG